MSACIITGTANYQPKALELLSQAGLGFGPADGQRKLPGGLGDSAANRPNRKQQRPGRKLSPQRLSGPKPGNRRGKGAHWRPPDAAVRGASGKLKASRQIQAVAPGSRPLLAWQCRPGRDVAVALACVKAKSSTEKGGAQALAVFGPSLSKPFHEPHLWSADFSQTSSLQQLPWNKRFRVFLQTKVRAPVLRSMVPFQARACESRLSTDHWGAPTPISFEQNAHMSFH